MQTPKKVSTSRARWISFIVIICALFSATFFPGQNRTVVKVWASSYVLSPLCSGDDGDVCNFVSPGGETVAWIGHANGACSGCLNFGPDNCFANGGTNCVHGGATATMDPDGSWYCWSEAGQDAACDYAVGAGNWNTPTSGPPTFFDYDAGELVSSSGESQYTDSGPSWYIVFYGTYTDTPTPTPTTSGGGGFATALPVVELPCVTITPRPTSTRQPTPTRFAQTPVATATRLPATPGPGLTYKNGPAKFDKSLAPWTIGDSAPDENATSFTGWVEEEGEDGEVGFAQIGDSFTFSVAPDTDSTINLPDALIFSYPNGIPTPIRVTGDAKFSSPILAGGHVYLRVFYLDPNFADEGYAAWVSTNSHPEQTNAWRKWDFTFPSSAITSTTALAITWYTEGAVNEDEALYVDNITITAGKAAVDASYPICTGTGGHGPQPPPRKICVITTTIVDVYNECQTPSDLLDIGGWIAFLWCRLKVYFTFNSINVQQLLALKENQGTAEPFGTIMDIVGALGALKDTLTDVERSNVNHFVQNRRVDFGELLNWTAIDTPPQLTVGPPDNSYMQLCDDLISNISRLAQRSACFVIWTVRTRSGLLNLFQWAIDIMALVRFAIYVKFSFGPKAGE